MERNSRMLTVEEAAKRLGLSVATVRAWIWRRKNNHTRIGRAVRISEAAIADIWSGALCRRATSDAEPKCRGRSGI